MTLHHDSFHNNEPRFVPEFSGNKQLLLIRCIISCSEVCRCVFTPCQDGKTSRLNSHTEERPYLHMDRCGLHHQVYVDFCDLIQKGYLITHTHTHTHTLPVETFDVQRHSTAAGGENLDWPAHSPDLNLLEHLFG
ncbi:hypothetical protein ILYODFUR_025640 [Ilyodon furcidens]|uniref:Uncharacterized protein n=1 Tax=Ilyodon furcidens TaxID=33524 RepID=A0ABV0V6T4_9TELE